MKRFNIKIAVIGIVAVLVCFFAVFAMFDWVVGLWVNNPYVDSPERTAWNQTYWLMLGIAMLAVGVFGAVVVKFSLPNRALSTKLSVAILFSTVVMIVGNLEDWLYFILGQQSLPGWDANLNWLFQASLNNGYWFTWQLAVWSVVWLFVVLPLGLVAIFKFASKR
jgi:hypothetical protein